MIIEHTRRLHLLAGMLFLLQFHRRIEINSKLQLQSIIERHQVERRISRLVIDNFHIDLIVRLAEIHAVNPSAQTHFLMLRQIDVDRRQRVLHRERNLEFPWLKFSLPDLLLQCPDSSFQDPLHADNAVLIPA